MWVNNEHLRYCWICQTPSVVHDQVKRVFGTLNAHELLLDNNLYIYSFQYGAQEDRYTTKYGHIQYG